MLFDAAIISPVFPGQEFLYDFVGLDSDLLTLAIWTILIEVPLFYFCGYREKRQLLYFAGVNLVSNLLLNGWKPWTILTNWQYWQEKLPLYCWNSASAAILSKKTGKNCLKLWC